VKDEAPRGVIDRKRREGAQRKTGEHLQSQGNRAGVANPGAASDRRGTFDQANDVVGLKRMLGAPKPRHDLVRTGIFFLRLGHPGESLAGGAVLHGPALGKKRRRGILGQMKSHEGLQAPGGDVESVAERDVFRPWPDVRRFRSWYDIEADNAGLFVLDVPKPNSLVEEGGFFLVSDDGSVMRHRCTKSGMDPRSIFLFRDTTRKEGALFSPRFSYAEGWFDWKAPRRVTVKLPENMPIVGVNPGFARFWQNPKNAGRGGVRLTSPSTMVI